MVTIEDFIHESADVDQGTIPDEVRKRVNDALEGINSDLYGTDDEEVAELEPPASDILERTQAEFEKRTAYSKEQLLEDRDTSQHEANGRISDDTVVAKFGKGLEHDGAGFPTADAYAALVEACETGAGYDAIPRGGPRPLVQPESAWTYMTEGGATAQLRIAKPPAFDSPETGAEMVELYWRALTRDVKFREYGDNDVVQRAADELGSLDAYNGPGADGTVTTDNVFRGVTPGATTGPYVSQFLWKERNLGGGVEDQKIEVQAQGSDYATTVTEWKAIQNGEVPSENELTGSRRHIITGRDLSERVHDDPPFRQLQKAAQVLVFTMNAPLDDGIPYTLKPFGEPSGSSRRNSENFTAQTTLPFNDFGPLYIEKKVLEASEHGQKAAWHKKWNVHRRLRPEEYGGRVQAALGDGLPSPDGVALESLIPDTLLDSEALTETASEFGSYLLPQAYAEGSPTHPSYPAGHSVVAGAGVTVLKALFDGDYEFPAGEKVVPTADGQTLETAERTDAMGVDETLTVRGELNKLASNMALGRNRAGIHYRSDGIEGLRLGEAAAVRFLEDQLALQTATGNIRLSLETFGGDQITIEPSA